jgi:hypothetical protein
VLRLDTPRSITQGELAVLRATLEKAAKVPLDPDVLAGLGSLRVIGGCECGCDSVDFAEHDPERPSRPIADGTGNTPAGGDVGIIIWGTDDAVTGIEVYDLGAGDADIKLPIESSIRPWEKRADRPEG